MKAILQRVNSATLRVDGKIVGEIQKGLVVLLGVNVDDTDAQAITLAKKTAELRIFTDENHKMNLSSNDLCLSVLVVSNFTLYGDCSGGRRPYFANAARPQKANELYELYVSELKKQNLSLVATGEFGADMKITTELDGPVTIILDTNELQKK